MKARVTEHLLSFVLVALVLICALFILKSRQDTARTASLSGIRDYTSLSFMDYDDPFQRALLRDVMDIYFPGSHDRNDSLVTAALRYRQEAFNRSVQTSDMREELSAAKAVQLFGMYLKFLFVYVLVMAISWYGVQTLAVWRFVAERREPIPGRRVRQYFLRALSIGASLVLFSPAYVIAYSVRTEFNTDTLFFMVLLGVVSNGLLMIYANKFHAFLTAESRKGYVETALAKNLRNTWDTRTGISLAAIVRPLKRFDGHVFNHIFMNARVQYFSTIKEQASFLITGLIIIEMALNIHGHFSYEMLRQLLYGNYDIVIAIILGIFFTVKATEMAADYLAHKEWLKYENH